MIVAVAVTVLGLLLGVVVVQSTGLRMSGVLVVPLLAVYGLYDITTLPVLLASIAVAYGALVVVERRTLLLGRELLVTSMLVSVLATFALSAPLIFADESGLLIDEIHALGSILPGVAAYNLRQIDAERRPTELAISLSVLASLLIFGASLVFQRFAMPIARDLPRLLFSSGADVAVYRNVPLETDPVTVLNAELAIPAVIAGLLLSEAIYGRWGVRLAGTIVIPLLALFATLDVAYLGLYLVALPIVYGVVTLVHRLTLTYGRVLLALALATALTLSVPAGYLLPDLHGFYLYFTAVFVGVGSYNYHRVQPGERCNSVALSAGLFVVFAAVVQTVVEPAPDGLAAVPPIVSVPVALVALTAGIAAAVNLERLRPSEADRPGVSTTLRGRVGS